MLITESVFMFKIHNEITNITKKLKIFIDFYVKIV